MGCVNKETHKQSEAGDKTENVGYFFVLIKILICKTHAGVASCCTKARKRNVILLVYQNSTNC